MKIGDKIRKIRVSKELSQEYIAQKLGMSTHGYGNIERDQVKVKIDRLEAIADILECSIFDFLENPTTIILNENNQPCVIQGVNTNHYYGEKDVELLRAEIKHLQDKIKLLEKLAGVSLGE